MRIGVDAGSHLVPVRRVPLLLQGQGGARLLPGTTLPACSAVVHSGGAVVHTNIAWSSDPV